MLSESKQLVILSGRFKASKLEAFSQKLMQCRQYHYSPCASGSIESGNHDTIASSIRACLRDNDFYAGQGGGFERSAGCWVSEEGRCLWGGEGRAEGCLGQYILNLAELT